LEPLASSWHCKKICHVIWTWKNTSKISSTNKSFFKGWGWL
jgi:hypothetical protein